jgi:hypothetical protein
MTLGSVPGINTTQQTALNALYGRQVVIREIYGATEGMFGQRRNEKRAWVPNYDQFFLEVQTRSGVKMLHEMRAPTRWSLGKSRIGRDRWYTPLRYAWDEFHDVESGQAVSEKWCSRRAVSCKRCAMCRA